MDGNDRSQDVRWTRPKSVSGAGDRLQISASVPSSLCYNMRMIVRNIDDPIVRSTTYRAHWGGAARMVLTSEHLTSMEFFAWAALPAGNTIEEHVDAVEEIYFILRGGGLMKVGGRRKGGQDGGRHLDPCRRAAPFIQQHGRGHVLHLRGRLPEVAPAHLVRTPPISPSGSISRESCLVEGVSSQTPEGRRARRFHHFRRPSPYRPCLVRGDSYPECRCFSQAHRERGTARVDRH